MAVNWVAKEAMEWKVKNPQIPVLIDRFITAETSAMKQKFISIVPADEANGIIQVIGTPITPNIKRTIQNLHIKNGIP